MLDRGRYNSSIFTTMKDFPQSNLDEFARRWKALLRRLDMSQNELAKKCGIPQPSLSAIASARRPCEASTISKICLQLPWDEAQRLAADWATIIGLHDLTTYITAVPNDKKGDAYTSALTRIDNESGGSLSRLVRKADEKGRLITLLNLFDDLSK